MPVEYVYKITVDDSDLSKTLKDIDAQLSNLGNRTAAAFDKVGTSMGKGVKQASADAKKALNDVEKAQKTASTTADKTEKAYIKLLASELKLAAGSNKLTKEFINQTAAGVQSGDALASLVLASTSLTEAQVAEAQAVATLRSRITELSAAMGQEGADTNALTAEIAGLQGQLNSIAAAKEAERAATEAAATAKREEAEATAAASAAMAKAQADAAAASERTEKSFVRLLAAELKLAAGSDQAAQEFIKQAAAGAQSADALGRLVAKSTSLTQSQVQQAQTVAFLKNQIQTLSAAMAEEGADTEALTGRISEYQAMLERIINTRDAEKAAADASVAAKKAEADAVARSADEIAKAQSTKTTEIDKSEQASMKLLAAELKLAAGSDKATKAFIDSAAAGTQNREQLLAVVNATSQMSDAQILAADRIDRLRQAITETSAAMSEEGADVAALEDRLETLTGMLDSQVKARERAIQAAKDQAEAERVVGDAVDKDDSLGDVSEEAERNEAAFMKLLAAELKVAAGADQAAQDLIKLATAGAQTGDAMLSAVSQTERLSEAQIDHAVKVATLKESIISLTAEMDKEGANVEELEEQIAEANGELERMETLKEQAAAAAQAHASGLEAEKAALDAQRQSSEEAQKEQAKQAKLNAVAQRAANREFTKLAKSFPEIKQALVELTGQYGTFKTVIGGTGQATGAAQEELHQLFKDNPKFARELEELTQKYGKFTATVQRADFGPRMKSTGQQVRQLGFALQRMGIGGVAAFGEIFAALGPLGLAIGAIIVPVVAITKALKKMAEEAVRAFKKITKEAFEAAKEFETTEAAFQAIFRAAGDSDVVQLSLRRVREESERLGVSLEEILPRILPKVSTIEQAFQIAELIPGLAASAIDLGPQDALRTIIEGLAGDLVSLRKAFEIDVTGIRKAQEELGLVDGLVVGLTAELEAMGLTFEDQAETINVKIGQLQQRWQSFKLLMGEPLVDAVKDQFSELFALLDSEEDTLHSIAIMIGTIVANLGTKLAGGLAEALNKIDPQDIERVANALGRIANVFIVQIQGIIGIFSGSGGIADFVERIAEVIEYSGNLINTLKLVRTISMQVNEVFMIIPNAIFEIVGSLIGFDTSMGLVRWTITTLSKGLESLIMILAVVSGSFAATITFMTRLVGGIGDIITGARSVKEVFADAMEEGVDAMNQQLQRAQGYLSDYEEVTLDAAAATRKLGEAGLLTANDILALNNAMKQLTDTEEEFLETQDEINEKIADFARDAESKFQGILTDLGRDLLDAQIDNQRKLVDIETKNLQAIQDIRSGFDQDVLAAAVDLGDREADIARKHGRAMGEIESDLNKARLKIEQDYLDDLERMRAKFDFDMFEAFLANDAKRLAQLRRRQAFEEKEAEKDRDRGLRDVDDKAAEEREARKLTLEQELEDARIANARAIRDLATALELQFAEQELSRKRDMESQALANKRKEEDMRDSFDRQLEDYDKWWQERHRSTSEAIAEDLEKMQKYVDDRNAILADIQNITQVASQIPLEELREMTAQRLNEVTNQNLQAAQTGMYPPGQAPTGVPLEQILPHRFATEGIGISALELTAATLADMTREELEQAFNEASLALEMPTLLEQQALNLTALDLERRGFHTAGVGNEQQMAFLRSMTEEELRTYISELVAELAGIEIPAMPEGFETMFPAGMAVPGAAGAPTTPQSGFYGVPGAYGAPLTPEDFPIPVTAAPDATTAAQQGQFATGGLASTVFPFAPTPEGYGFPPTLPPDMAQLPNYFLPGNLMPIPPTFGFDAETYFDMLDDQTEAQASAELEMRGEIADTVDLAALLAEQRASLHASYLDDEVASSQIASDAQIEIMEKTLAAQRIALAAIQGDPNQQIDIDALQTSIAVLEDVITRARLQQAALAAETVQAEADAIIAAEETKRDESEATTDALETAMDRRLGVIERTMHGEIDAAEEAKDEQIGLTDARLALQGAMAGEFRQQEFEAQSVAEEEMAELLANSGNDTLDMQYDWWQDLLSAQTQGIDRDLRLMLQWLEQRQRIWQQMQMTLPGNINYPPGEGPALPGVGGGELEDGDTGGGIAATLQELQNMAITLAQQLGMEMGIIRAEILAMTYDELAQFVAWLQEQLGSSGYALGGGFLPYKRLLVGENEPEVVEFNRAGNITPLSAFMERPPSSRLPDIGGTGDDYSINMRNEFPDPRGLSPAYTAAMENIAAKVAIKVWSSRRRR